MLLRTYQSNSERVVKLQRIAVTRELSTIIARKVMRSFRLIVMLRHRPSYGLSHDLTASDDALLLGDKFVPDAINCLKAFGICRVSLNFLT